MAGLLDDLDASARRRLEAVTDASAEGKVKALWDLVTDGAPFPNHKDPKLPLYISATLRRVAEYVKANPGKKRFDEDDAHAVFSIMAGINRTSAPTARTTPAAPARTTPPPTAQPVDPPQGTQPTDAEQQAARDRAAVRDRARAVS